MPTLVKADCIYQIGLLHIAPIQCGLDGQLHDREYCLKCKDKVSLTCKHLILKNNEPNICNLTKELCAEEEGEKCDKRRG